MSDKNLKQEEEVKAQAATPEVVPEWAKALLESNAKLQKDNDMFRQMMGDNKIKSWEHAQKDHSNKFCHFKVMNGKPVIAWGDLNMRMFNPAGVDARAENMLMTVTYVDGTSEEINYHDFVVCTDLQQAQLLSFGEFLSTVKFEDGKILEIPTKFLNA